MGLRFLKKGEKFPTRKLFLAGILLAVFTGWWTRGLVPDIRIVEVPIQKQALVVSNRKGAVALEPIGGIWAAQVTVNNIRGVFFIDTGAAITIVSKEFARKADISAINSGFPMTSVTGIFRPSITTAREVSVGGATIKDLPVAIYDTKIGSDGIIGMNFLESFELVLNARHRTLDLRYVPQLTR